MKRPLIAALILLAVCRLGLALYSGFVFQTEAGSDFEQNLPPGFLNPHQPPATSLAEALSEPWTMESYPRGPSEYLVVLPLAFIGPFATLSIPLLGVGAFLILALTFILWRIAIIVQETPTSWVWIFVSTLCFTPLVEALVIREFEILITVLFALAAWAMIRNRPGVVGAIFAYVSLFKYLPLITLPYLIIRRWWTALAGFAICAALLLIAAQAAFGLDRFSNNNIIGMAGNRLTGFASADAFCDTPVQLLYTLAPEDADDSIRRDLCRHTPVPNVIFLLIVFVMAGAVAYATHRFQLAADVMNARAEQWRRLLELALLIVVASTFVFSHYYYLAMLIVPFNLLLARFNGGVRWSPVSLAWWGLAYFLIGQFMVPSFMIDRLFGIQLGEVYQTSPARLIGELILLTLLLKEYVGLALEVTTNGKSLTSLKFGPGAPVSTA